MDSGRELGGVVAASERLAQHPMGEVEGTRIWQVGAAVRTPREQRNAAVDPFAAGMFAAVMIVQVDLLRAKGH